MRNIRDSSWFVGSVRKWWQKFCWKSWIFSKFLGIFLDFSNFLLKSEIFCCFENLASGKIWEMQKFSIKLLDFPKILFLVFFLKTKQAEIFGKIQKFLIKFPKKFPWKSGLSKKKFRSLILQKQQKNVISPPNHPQTSSSPFDVHADRSARHFKWIVIATYGNLNQSQLISYAPLRRRPHVQ